MGRLISKLGRRNLTPDQMSLIRGRRHNRIVDTPHKDRCKNYTGSEKGRTAEKLAAEHGVHTRTIMHDAKFARAVDVLPEVKDKIQRGEKVVVE